MKKFICGIILCFLSCTMMSARKVIYQPADSIQVEKLLKEAKSLPKGTNRVLFFAKKFIGLPYVAHTLEVDTQEEYLTVNLRELDCTTYVDVVCALTLASEAGKTHFADFCYYLQHQRYPKGVIKDYASRNHYYTSWILNCEKQGFTHEISVKDLTSGKQAFTATQKLKCTFMTEHPQYYKQLKLHPELIPKIEDTQRKLNKLTVYYIPNKNLGWSKKQLSQVKDGDILALVTSKDGLDVSHLGFAVWVKNRLHLLNASGLYHKVLLDSQPLKEYNIDRKTNLGTRVVRIK